MAMSFAQAQRAQNPDLAEALAAQTNISNQLKAGENQAKMQNRNSNMVGGAMLAQAAPEGTFWGPSGGEGAAIDQGLANSTGTITPAAETAAVGTEAAAAANAAEAASIIEGGGAAAGAAEAAAAAEAATAAGTAASAAGAGGSAAGGAAAAGMGMTPIGWAAMGLMAANQFGLFD